MSLKNKTEAGLARTRAGLGARLQYLFRSRKAEKEFFKEFEEILITSDVGLKTTQLLVESFRDLAAKDNLLGSEALQGGFVDHLLPRLSLPKLPELNPEALNVVLLLGVNGSGKTTTAGKLAHEYQKMGYRVLLAAADTFRAAAVDQLEAWAKRVDARIVKQQAGADPGAVVFDALEAAKARGYNLVLVDTAGRFHNRENLVKELKKIDKIIATKTAEGDNYFKLIVLDATSGGNAFTQASSFNEAVRLDAAILTKLDSSAKGGVVLPLSLELELGIYRIGVGEGLDDLIEFDPGLYLESLFS